MGIETLVTDFSLQEVYKKSTRKLQESLIKTCDLFGWFRRNNYLCTRWWVMKRLVAHLRVFIEAIYSRLHCNATLCLSENATLLPLGGRTWNWVRSPIRNPVFPQFPRLPLFKEIQQILTKLRKVERKTKKLFLFFAETKDLLIKLRYFRVVPMMVCTCSAVIYEVSRWYFGEVKYHRNGRKVTLLRVEDDVAATPRWRCLQDIRSKRLIQSKQTAVPK